MSSFENKPVDLKNIRITDPFWKTESELVRTEVIPYQWEALNDRVPGAAKSFAMHNFKAAGRLNRYLAEHPDAKAPVFEDPGFEVLPEDDDHIDPDHFYGFLFQDSDFYKWVEAVAYSLTQHPDAELEAVADEAIHTIALAQTPDGYLDTYYILNGRDASFSNLRDNHELYCFGHLTEAAVAYFEATGKDELLNVARRFAEYIAAHIGKEEGKKHGYPGHEIAEMALVRLYETTKDPQYLALSEYFINERGQDPKYFHLEGHRLRNGQTQKDSDEYYQAHLPVRSQDEAVGHAVRAVYLYSGIADIARITGDEELKAAARKLFRSISREKMYITGGIGATHIGEAFSFPFDLPNDTNYAESCASIGLIFFMRRMLQMEPVACYADVMERALYNTVLSGMALDGKSFFYVNPLEVFPEADIRDERKRHIKTVRQKWFGCACCPPNIARLLSSIGTYAYTENEDTLFQHLYIGADYEKKMKEGNANVSVVTDLSDPFCLKLNYRIEHAPAGFRLAVRRPEWCDDMCFDGVKDEEVTFRDGYYYISKDWKPEDEIKAAVTMHAKLMRADVRVRDDIGRAALVLGPTVYCLEEHDNGKELMRLAVAHDTGSNAVETEERDIGGRKVVGLKLPGLRLNGPSQDVLYTEISEDPETFEEVTLHFIPYYCWCNRGENEMSVFIRKL